jgi:hypothetical protein
MPFELGVFLGAKFLGPPEQKRKNGLILDTERYRYQKFCSDIAGQDIRAHGNKISNAVIAVRNWLRSARTGTDAQIPGGEAIVRRYKTFMRQLPRQCSKLKLNHKNLPFADYAQLVVGWLDKNP